MNSEVPEEIIVENINIIPTNNQDKNGSKQIAGAIIIAGLLIAGAVLLKGNTGGGAANTAKDFSKITLAKVTAEDHTLGNPEAKVTLVMYEDFQCPFCAQFFIQTEQKIKETYVKDGKVLLVYRDYAFLGERAKQLGLDPEDESVKSAEAARCAADQSKFWEYHDYLFTHQNGENQRGFSTEKLESFAKELGLDTTTFHTCLSSDKYNAAVMASKAEATTAGVTGTPKGFILKKGKIVDTVDGAEPLAMVKAKLDAALK